MRKISDLRQCLGEVRLVADLGDLHRVVDVALRRERVEEEAGERIRGEHRERDANPREHEVHPSYRGRKMRSVLNKKTSKAIRSAAHVGRNRHCGEKVWWWCSGWVVRRGFGEGTGVVGLLPPSDMLPPSLSVCTLSWGGGDEGTTL